MDRVRIADHQLESAAVAHWPLTVTVRNTTIKIINSSQARINTDNYTTSYGTLNAELTFRFFAVTPFCLPSDKFLHIVISIAFTSSIAQKI